MQEAIFWKWHLNTNTLVVWLLCLLLLFLLFAL